MNSLTEQLREISHDSSKVNGRFSGERRNASAAGRDSAMEVGPGPEEVTEVCRLTKNKDDLFLSSFHTTVVARPGGVKAKTSSSMQRNSFNQES